jgi:hypothetical protein
VSWPQQPVDNIGAITAVPPTWTAQSSAGGVVLTDAASTDEITPETVFDKSFFRISRQKDANPLRLTLDEWFDNAIAPLLEGAVHVRQHRTVASGDALYVEASGVLGMRVYIYLLRGPDVIVITHGLFSPKFTAAYQALVNNLVIPD